MKGLIKGLRTGILYYYTYISKQSERNNNRKYN